VQVEGEIVEVDGTRRAAEPVGDRGGVVVEQDGGAVLAKTAPRSTEASEPEAPETMKSAPTSRWRLASSAVVNA
jgi:hypothetical protein